MKTLPSRIRRLILLTSIASFALAACGTSSQAAHVTTIGIVNYTVGLDPVIAGLKANLADAGFVEGKTIAYLYDGPVAVDNTATHNEIQKIANQNPDLYLAVGSLPSTRIGAVLQKTTNYPVFAPVPNPQPLAAVQDLPN